MTTLLIASPRPEPQVFIVLLVNRPSGLRPWRVLLSDRSALGSDLPVGLITHLERLFGPINPSDIQGDQTVLERKVIWPAPDEDF